MRKIIPVVVSGATALAIAGGTFGYVTLNKDVTLSVDGQARTVSTAAGTVGDLLDAEGIKTGSHDVVAPAPTSKLTEGGRVAVQFGREVTFTVDGKPQTIWTTATSLDQAITALGVDTAGANLSTSRSSTIGREGLTVDVATRKTVTVNALGKARTVTTTAQTVAGALAAAKIKPDADDKVSVATSAPLVDGAKVTYTKVDVKTVKEKQKISYSVVRKSTNKLTKGKTKVDTTGRAGTREITYREVRYDGKLQGRKTTGTKVVAKPRTQIVLVGTKKVVAKASPSKSSGSAPSVASGSVWDKIAQCESGGNWSINTGNGYYGGLQFSLATWRSVGGTGLPSDQSRAEQIKRAEILQARSGWGQWSCAHARFN